MRDVRAAAGARRRGRSGPRSRPCRCRVARRATTRAQSTSDPTTSLATPNESGVCFAMPWWSTSHGGSPSRDSRKQTIPQREEEEAGDEPGQARDQSAAQDGSRAHARTLDETPRLSHLARDWRASRIKAPVWWLPSGRALPLRARSVRARRFAVGGCHWDVRFPSEPGSVRARRLRQSGGCHRDARFPSEPRPVRARRLRRDALARDAAGEQAAEQHQHDSPRSRTRSAAQRRSANRPATNGTERDSGCLRSRNAPR